MLYPSGLNKHDAEEAGAAGWHRCLDHPPDAEVGAHDNPSEPHEQQTTFS